MRSSRALKDRNPLSFRSAAAMAASLLIGVLSACSSGGSGSAGQSADVPGVTANSVTVGLITSLTGPSAASFSTVLPGFNARIALQNAEGGVNDRTIKVVDADDQGTTTTALSAAQTLVQQKKVFAVGSVSPTLYAAEPYLKQQGIPVIGYPLDGVEWASPNENMFPALGSPSPKLPAARWYGTFFKSQGATNVAVVTVAIPAGVASAKNMRASVEAAGLKSAYGNYTVPLTQEGSFNSIIAQMQASGADGVYIELFPTAAFNFLAAIRQSGWTPKTILIGAPIPSAVFSNPQARATAAGIWVATPFVPTSLHTPSTLAFQAALLKYEHQTSAPDENEYAGWAVASTLIKGLEAAGKNMTQASFTQSLRKVNGFTVDGLSSSPVSYTASFGTGGEGAGPAPEDCVYMEQYNPGVNAYVSQPKPICGGLVPNSNAA